MMDKYIKIAASLDFTRKKHKDDLRNTLKEKFRTEQNLHGRQLSDDDLLNVAGGITDYENETEEIKTNGEQE